MRIFFTMVVVIKYDNDDNRHPIRNCCEFAFCLNAAVIFMQLFCFFSVISVQFSIISWYATFQIICAIPNFGGPNLPVLNCF